LQLLTTLHYKESKTRITYLSIMGIAYMQGEYYELTRCHCMIYDYLGTGIYNNTSKVKKILSKPYQMPYMHHTSKR